jgi:o-succinylbenzoate synthase
MTMPADVRVRDLPLRAPLVTGGVTIAMRRVWVLRIAHGDHLGLGEAAPLARFGGETPDACATALAAAAAALTADRIASWLAGGRALGDDLETLLAHAPCARHAVEGALLDLLAQRIGVPLARLLGADGPLAIPVNALIGGEGDDASAAVRAQAAHDVGFGTLKLKLPADPAAAAARVRAVRRALGPGAVLRADANAAWNLGQALHFAHEIATCGLDYCEQPLPADDLAGLASLRRAGLRIGADESVRTPADVDRVAEAGGADVVVLKPMFLGGWAPLHDAVRRAGRHRLDVVVTSSLDGAIGRAAATHYAIALGLTDRAHGLSTGGVFAHDLTGEPLSPANGQVALRDRPGLGIGDLVPGPA